MKRALRQLDDIARTRGLDPTLLADIERTRAQAELAVGNPFGAVRNLVRREQYLAAREAVADNQLQIWKILSGQPRLRLATELNLTRDPAVAGWIELTLAVTENAAAAGRLAGAIENWKKLTPPTRSVNRCSRPCGPARRWRRGRAAWRCCCR